MSLVNGCASTGIVHYRDPGAIGPYSGAVAANGFVFLSGKIGDPKTNFTDQVHAVLATIDKQLAEVKSDWAHVVQVTVYLTDMNRYADFNAIYSNHVGLPDPARVVVEVSALPAGALVEIQVTALPN
jgi:2-iminobutanoate/2-iminopropanoate deaminase